jgi:two-component system, chemotaxis family, response regulator Rcp1
MASILLVEDSAICVEMVQEAFAECGHPGSVHVVGDGEKALAFLRQEGLYAGASRPDLILLDLNLPKKGGCEVLAEIKADARLGSIPVLILTTSDAELDIGACYRLHANGYIVKPLDLAAFFAAMRSVVAFWLDTVKLPQD